MWITNLGKHFSIIFCVHTNRSTLMCMCRFILNTRLCACNSLMKSLKSAQLRSRCFFLILDCISLFLCFCWLLDSLGFPLFPLAKDHVSAVRNYRKISQISQISNQINFKSYTEYKNFQKLKLMWECFSILLWSFILFLTRNSLPCILSDIFYIDGIKLGYT